ncbi:MAG: succinyldiaminopimelate transaminase [Actinobacteria bacterium]|nr:succinyldiaminopimelate transaminase [Actinomycetota bacterium]
MKLPDFPWDTLAPYGQRARQHRDGIIDLSVGTPVDPTPQIVQKSLRESSNAPGYPLTVGTPALRASIRDWAIRRLGAKGEFDLLPLIGSKELVAWLPTLLQSKRVLFPEVAYPTYSVGAILASAVGTPVPIDPSAWPDADLAWINSPSNPTGRVHSIDELEAVIAWGRAKNSVIASDECYLDFGHGIKPTSILMYTNGENKNILAVHSLSKRSSMAGYRAGFIVGDPNLIARLREIRKHAGMIVPLPIQNAMAAALADELHVAKQRQIYNARRERLKPALERVGFRIEETRAGLYIWCTRDEEDWDSVAWLAELGILVTPGHFYGVKGARNIRIALTATDSHIDEAISRLNATSRVKK